MLNRQKITRLKESHDLCQDICGDKKSKDPKGNRLLSLYNTH